MSQHSEQNRSHHVKKHDMKICSRIRVHFYWRPVVPLQICGAQSGCDDDLLPYSLVGIELEKVE